MFHKTSTLPYNQQTVFEYHSQLGAIDRLIPPWERVKILKRNDSLQVGSEVLLQQSLGPLKMEWLAKHTAFEPPIRFQDQQIRGPFKSWIHDHIVEPVSEQSAKLTDSVIYQLPYGPAGRLGSSWIADKISSMFSYRHRTTLLDLDLVSHFRSLVSNNTPLRIGIAGSSGMIGRRVCALASIAGIEVVRIVRPGAGGSDAEVPSHKITELSTRGFADQDAMEGLDAVIHLGGFGIADRRWTTSTKEKILSSRVDSTKSLVHWLKTLKTPPKKFVCASGVGAYGDRGEDVCSDMNHNHDVKAGDTFLEQVSRLWEAAASDFSDRGTVCIGRLAMAIHPLQGALSKMIPVFRLGLGGPMGNGKQYWSWIHVDDAAAAFLHLAINPNSSGVYNLASPEPLTNSEFSRVLAHKLGRWSVFPAPQFGLKLMLGQMADELLLSSVRALPDRLESEMFPFRAKTLSEALGLLLP